MRIYSISSNLSVIDIEPPIPGFEGFIGIYVVRGRNTALIDVGPSSCLPNLLHGLEALNIRPDEVSHILATHIHIDHAGGMGKATKYLPKAEVIVHEQGKKHLVNPQRLWEGSKKALAKLAEQYGQIDPLPEERVLIAREGMIIELGDGVSLQVIATPGHASHHLSFLEKKVNRLFIGEAGGVYVGGIVRPSTPPPFDMEQAMASLDKLLGLKPSTLCYGHFGCAEDARGKLRSYKKQLTLWGETIAECQQRGRDIEETYSEIARRDRGLEHLLRLPLEQYQRERYFVLNSIRGFREYFDAHSRIET